MSGAGRSSLPAGGVAGPAAGATGRFGAGGPVTTSKSELGISGLLIWEAALLSAGFGRPKSETRRPPRWGGLGLKRLRDPQAAGIDQRS
jgi:hypothetical protein